jgi:hypothetical protein
MQDHIKQAHRSADGYLQLSDAGYLALSEAMMRLGAGMWGGLKRPMPLRSWNRYPPVYAPRQDYAAKQFTRMILSGGLTVFVVAEPQPVSEESTPPLPPTKEPVAVPTGILKHLISWRHAIPDHVIRPTLKTVEGNIQLLVLLTVGILVVQEKEFERWYRSERARRKWPSQRSAAKPRRGRPIKRDRVKDEVLTLVRGGRWRANDGFAVLRRLLLSNNCSYVPSTDTLRRFVDDMHVETGEPRLLRDRLVPLLPHNND